MGHNRNDSHNTKLQVLIQPNIGLGSDVRHPVVEILNHTLANEAVLTLKTRSAHWWNVSRASSLELYILFDSQYEQLNTISSEIAERARMLGGVAIGSLQEFTHYSRLFIQPGNAPDIMNLLADHEASIRFLREDAKKCSEEYADEGIRGFLIDVLFQHEKMAWALRSYIENEPVHSESQKGLSTLVGETALLGLAGLKTM